jgi:membrane protease YdiL (CAAX protease family)
MTQGLPDLPDSPDPGSGAEEVPFAVPLARPIGAGPSRPAGVAPLLVPNCSRPWALLELGVLGLVMLGCMVLLGLLLERAGFVDEQYNINPWGNVVGVAVNGTAAMVCVVALTLLRGGSLAELGLTGRHLAWNGLLGLGAFLAALAAFQFVGLLVSLLAGGEALAGNVEKIEEMLPRMHWLGFLALSVWVGLWEELTFRGFILTRLRRVTGFWWAAILISSVLFALPHMVQQVRLAVIPLFAIGVIWSVFTVWRQSVLPAVIGHTFFNFAQLIVIFYFADLLEQPV